MKALQIILMVQESLNETITYSFVLKTEGIDKFVQCFTVCIVSCLVYLRKTTVLKYHSISQETTKY